MKNLKYILGVFIALLVVACQDDDISVGDLIAPSNIEIQVDIIGSDATNPNGDGSGSVNFTATANNAISYHFVIQNQTKLAVAGSVSHDFTLLGLNTYPITVVAFGSGGISSSKTIEVEVLSLYEPPADLITMLTSDASRTWKIAAEVQNHFGLGPIGGDPFQFFGAAPNDKAATGMYDDRYTFNIDGTFTHNTGADGLVFGRKVLIEELAGPGGVPNGDDIEQYPYASSTENWSLSAPGGQETISLTGLGFMGYYVGGDHKYQIYSRSANEMVVKTADGNGQFDWWFRLIPE
ncbi:MAG: glucan endo-1,3-beta-D-glucosidase [Flavobacteriales bacterium]|nr:glucan endo-1,3-beta-D-glucosidase [Flavobacteriia bacterium]NCP89632.1 glucan endo-1,3-beta-D-glucosidase [Flavobacteriales bacterium]PIV94650.1 MAG: glucan endo-1,3-beta-D-glucosidase [Flavobacteriaceae bacterium CG17_big_fil_post_rev_8_21_14_2_50_33_15]PIY13259.1 MAG: glucan endo-1,3-beta-D-glucosidase [Flavobacteriaceae bacterium CG_4_10_14_3_um_filter_33_47]PJB16812.1 MAG: glucan endo-1,3-beta-D-glucosidase [Flavobacteriaceae bacterium CG_4_9_14_3_um_filter_33_16]